MPRARKRLSAPPVGSTYERQFKGRNVQMTVVSANGGVAYRVSGRDFRSPSAAAKSITGTEVNGWEFWRINLT